MAAITRTTTISTVTSDHDADTNVRSWVEAGPSYPDPEYSDTTLNYYKDAAAPPPDADNSQLTEHQLRLLRRSDASPNIAPTPVRVRNIRGHETDYSVREQGFAIAALESHMPSAAESWRDEGELRRVYFPEVDALLKRVLGCRQTLQYEWHVRAATLEEALAAGDTEGLVDINGPVRRVHIDESPASAAKEFAYWHPEVASQLQAEGRKFGIYNVWKPLKAIRRDPLCLCDARSLRNEDLQLGKVTVPKVGEIENFAVRSPEVEGRHEWAYLRGMGTGEAYVFRIYDGRVDGEGSGKRSWGVAHTSFVDPGTEAEEARESVEVRSFVVF